MINFTLKRALTLALSLALALSALPLSALATEEDGLCQHHPVHTQDCGFAQSGVCTHLCSEDTGCVTTRCIHIHDAACYNTSGELNCLHRCSENCTQTVQSCVHMTHEGCGHSEGQDCSYAENGCEECENPVTGLKGTDVTIDGYTFYYTGEEIKPAVTVTVEGITLKEGVHYTLSYADNIAAGTGSLTVTGIPEGGYEGIVTIPFEIIREPGTPEYTMVEIKGTDVLIDGTEFPYTGKAIEPAVTVTVNGKVLTAGKDYTLAYTNNIQPGTATVTVTGIATASETLGYTGQVTIDFVIAPAAEIPEQPEQPETPEEPEQPEAPEETQPVEYKITKGNGAAWYMGSGKTLSFTANGAYSDFEGISINGKALSSGSYTVKEGSTVITLKQSYLNKLTKGKYTITIHFADGDAEGTFSVKDNLDTSNPATGDSIGLWVSVMLVSLAGLAGAAVVCRKRSWN